MQSWDQQRAVTIVEQLKALPGALLPILHALQEEFGYVDPSVVPAIADALNLSKAEVHGTISFYHDFRHEPPGKHVLKMCRAEACQAMGCDSVIEHVEKRLGAKLGETTSDGAFTLGIKVGRRSLDVLAMDFVGGVRFREVIQTIGLKPF